MEGARIAVEQVFRRESGRVLATLIRALGDFDLAEEALQDAFAVAVDRWAADGPPANPGAWLTTVARRKALDRLRREGGREAKEAAAARLAALADDDPPTTRVEDTPMIDDRLRPMFTCCHPALSMDARVALTLRTLGGLTTPEIAHAFLVSEPTLAQRLVRAQRKIKLAGIPYRVPPDHQLPDRLTGVLSVVYLVFNEGYMATSGDAVIRHELCGEAVRLGRLVADLMPDEPEALGLLALLLLQHARRDARTGPDGAMVLLPDQDRSRWNRDEIAEGMALLDRALRRRQAGSPLSAARAGPFQLQAAIAALHGEAATADETDWPQIAALYGELLAVAPSPVVELNRAVAVAMADGPGAGLALADRLADAGVLDGYHLLHSTRADLLRRLGRAEESARAYRRAAGLTQNAAERRFLESRLAEVSAAPD
jgi:RNA polymerase sigma-70 factor (ECF subfamily)